MQTPTDRNRTRMLLVGTALAVVIGIVGYRVLVASSSRGQVGATVTPLAPQTFMSEALTLTYPGGWKVLDMGQQEACNQTGVECLLHIGSPSGEGTNINLMSFTLDQGATVEELDQALWAQFESGNPDVVVESREAIEVGGQPAIRRIFNIPSQQVPSGRAHLLQIFIVKELSLYQFTVFAPSADALTQHLTEIEEILSSLQFTP